MEKSETQDTVVSGMHQATKAAKETASQAAEWAQEGLESMSDAASQSWEQGREMAMDWMESVEGQIRRAPLSSILIATGIGVLIGACLSRRA